MDIKDFIGKDSLTDDKIIANATTLMRPSKSIMDLEVKSVKKKWKQSSFAAGANREVIAEGAVLLEMDIEDIIAETIKGMQNVADAIGLRGVE